MKKYRKELLFIFFGMFFISCNNAQDGNLVHLQIVDRNGFTKTVTDSEQIKKYDVKDLKAPSPHQKIVRIYDKKKGGIITLYHKNGFVHQYLEIKDGRANGIYEEYYVSGVLKIKAKVIEGIADLTDEAKTSWVFDGKSCVYDENGNIFASIPYQNGEQVGVAEYYFPSGKIKAKEPYSRGKISGEKRGYNEKGELILLTNFLDGIKEGESFFKGSKEKGAYEEVYRNGRLIHGKYFDLDGSFFSEIISSKGLKPKFKNGVLISTQEYVNGYPQGLVTNFKQDRTKESTYYIKDGKKHGEEIIYYRTNPGVDPIKKMSTTWREGLIHGKVCSWYSNGVLESEREVCDHKKEGTYIAWYEDSSLMMVEEYHKDNLINGKYLRKGDNVPISRVIDGTGKAHIYDKEGALLKVISYYNGIPIE
jgi:antitoxin component YwqK of YwqJK toxin-antitoxin module